MTMKIEPDHKELESWLCFLMYYLETDKDFMKELQYDNPNLHKWWIENKLAKE